MKYQPPPDENPIPKKSTVVYRTPARPGQPRMVIAIDGERIGPDGQKEVLSYCGPERACDR